MAPENVYLRADGEQDGHHYQTITIVTKRDGAPLTEGDTPSAQGLATLANFAFIVDGNPTAPYEPYVLVAQAPTARELGIQYVCMRCRPGSADWERLLRLGFDAPLDQRLLAPFLAHVEGLEFALADRAEGVDDLTVRTVLNTDTGRSWWHKQGSIEPILYFDCAEGAESGLILAELGNQERGGPMREIAPGEWRQPIPRPGIPEWQQSEETERLARWSAAWHDHLVEVYEQARIDQIQRVGDDLEE